MLKAGAACLDITPPLGTLMPGYFHERRATAVHDPLLVRAFALEQRPVPRRCHTPSRSLNASQCRCRYFAVSSNRRRA